jgi:hypothetical protein
MISIKDKLNMFNYKINGDDIKVYSKKGWISPPSPTLAVKKLNENIINDIVDKQYENVSKIINSKDDPMEYAFFDVMIYRHCLIFIVIQYSYNTQNVRFMAYGVNVILHSSQGTNLEIAKEADIIQFIEEGIDKHIIQKTEVAMSFKVLKKIAEKDYLLFI